jgi:integrase
MRGSVGKREGPQGTSWWWKLGGTQRRGYPTRKAAQAALDEAKVAQRRGDWIEPSKEPLSAYLARWLESTAHRRKAQSTASYADGIAVIGARIGTIPLGKLSTLDVQELVTALSARYAPRTVRERHMVLKQALAQAVRWRLVSYNAADGVDLPRVPKVDRGVWNKDEVSRFLEEADRHLRGCPSFTGSSAPSNGGQPAQSIKELALWRLLLDSGMRIGEAVALKWTDIDGNRVRVERTQSSVGGQLVVGTPKTAAPSRSSRRRSPRCAGTSWPRSQNGCAWGCGTRRGGSSRCGAGAWPRPRRRGAGWTRPSQGRGCRPSPRTGCAAP